MGCVVIPTITNISTNTIEESKLFKDLLEVTKSRNLTKKIFKAVNSKSFKKDWDNDLEKMDNGEYTIDSLLSRIDLKIPLSTLENYILKNFKNRQIPYNIDNHMQMIQEVLNYNNDSKFAKLYPAHIEINKDALKVSLSKTTFDSEKYKDNLAELILTKNIQNELNILNFDKNIVSSYIRFLKSSGLSGIDSADKVIRNINQISNFFNGIENNIDIESLEFFVSGMLSNSLISRFYNYIQNHKDYFNILDQEYSQNTYSEPFLIQKSIAQVLYDVMNNSQNKYSDSHINFANRILNYLAERLNNVDVNKLKKQSLDLNTKASLSASEEGRSRIKTVDMEEIKYSTVTAAQLAGAQANKSQEEALKIIEEMSGFMNTATKIAEAKNIDSTPYIKLNQELKMGLALGRTLGAISGFMMSISKEFDDINNRFKQLDSGIMNFPTQMANLKAIRNFIRAIEISIAPLTRYVNSLPIVPQDSPLFTQYQNIRSAFTVLTANTQTIKIGFKDRAKKFYFDFLSEGIDDAALYDPISKKTRTKEDILFGEIDEKSPGNEDRCLTDISSFDRYVYAAGDSTLDIVQLFDKASKRAKFTARKNALKYKKELQNLQTQLEKAGFGDTSWMFKTDDKGKYTGYYITPWSWTKFKQKLSSTKPEDIAFIKNLRKQDKLYIYDDNSEQNVPNPEYFPHDQFSKLSDTQKKFYELIMYHKKYLEFLLPPARRNVYRAVGIRNSMYQRLLKNGIDKLPTTIKESIKDSIGFRDGEDLDSRSNIIDFDNKKVIELPYLYQNLTDNIKEDLCTDVMGTLTAYSAMAHNVHSTNNIAGALELCLYTIKDDIPIKKAKENRDAAKTGGDSNIVKRLEDFMDMQVYDRYLKDEGNIGKVNVAKGANSLIRLTALNSYALNMVSAIANVTVGNVAQKIESFCGQYYNELDTLWADKTYAANILSYLNNIGKRVKKDKLSLWEEHFNTLQDYAPTNQQVHNYLKSRLGQQLGEQLLYSMTTAGEHWMAHRNMLALAHKQKVLYKGAEISLWDAYEVAPVDPKDPEGAQYLKLKEGVTNLDGSIFTRNDEFKFERRAADIAQKMHGIYNNEDKCAIQQLAVGRLAMLYRRWIVPSLLRRYQKGRYNYDLHDWDEGYYRTTWRVLKTMVKELREHQTGIMVTWNQLKDFEKANVSRTITEMGIFALTLAAIGVLGAIKDDDDDDWFTSMLLVQIYRLKTEIGALTPTPYLLTESLRIIQSPTAAVNTVQSIIDLLQLLNPSNYETFAGEEAILQKGRFEGYSRAEKLLIQSPLFPTAKTVFKALSPEDMLPFYMSNIF